MNVNDITCGFNGLKNDKDCCKCKVTVRPYDSCYISEDNLSVICWDCLLMNTFDFCKDFNLEGLSEEDNAKNYRYYSDG